MGKVKDPVLFSSHFGVPASALEAAGLVDPFLNVDTQLFIDPVLLEKSSNAIISGEALPAFKQHFENFIRLLTLSQREGDAPWKAAQRLLDLTEPPDNGLGYGSSGRSGASRPETIRTAIMRTAKEIVTLGSNDPEMIGLMGFFEEDVGPDTISDFTTRVIVQQLAKITTEFCRANGVPTAQHSGGYELPSFSLQEGKTRYVLLVPQDIVRDLPIANDFSDIFDAISATQEIRDRVNKFLGANAKHTVADQKAAVRKTALESGASFDLFLRAIKEFTEPYGKDEDTFAYYKIRELFTGDKDQFKTAKSFDLSKGIESIIHVVRESIEMFKHHVENGNLWEELWVGGKPKRERAAQLIYYAIADCFCKINNIDISPEANMGGGPIDFKFSKGYDARVLVEMKKSNGTVKHGYEKQLEFYKEAARTFHGLFVIIDYGDLGTKLAVIQKIRSERLDAGEPASDIIVIDATPKLSASKRH